MNKKNIFMFLLVFVFGSSLNVAQADTAIHLNIKTPSTQIYDQDITMTPCDSDNAGTLKITAYCAVLQSGISSTWDWTWAPGAFVTSINSIAGYTSKDKNNNDVYHYWSWSLNGTEGSVGLNQYELQPNDLISLNFIDPIEPPDPTPNGSGPLLVQGTTTTRADNTEITENKKEISNQKPVFDTKKAFEFLIAQQRGNGSWGTDLYTDWATLALVSGNYQTQIIKLTRYFSESKFENKLLTDYERRAMVLMVLGLNPYNTNNENYIQKIIDSFDGTQFGNANEDNDDIFALIVLQNTGYTKEDKIVIDDISFVLKRQKENGSWDESVDMTGATIEALAFFKENEQVNNALTKAKNFLKEKQKSDGSWDNNTSATGWVLEGLLALGEKPEDWKQGDNTPVDYFTTLQDMDGGIKTENLDNKIWQTAYVVPVLVGKNWNQLMQKFEKIETPVTTKIAKKISKKLSKINTATVINAIVPASSTNQTETQKKSWFTILIDNIFGFF